MRQVHVTRTLADAYLVAHVLRDAGIATTVRNEHLVGTEGGRPQTPEFWPTVEVADADHDKALQVLAEHQADTEVPDALNAIASEDDGADDPRAQERMADLYRVAAGLARDPARGALIDEALRLTDGIAGAPSPFGVDPRAWTGIALLAERIVQAATDDELEVVQSAATELRDLLAPLVGAEAPHP